MSSLVLKLKQTQQLNQRLQQSLRILQMSGLELEREVEDWLLDNPLLERPETDEFADSGLNRAVTMPRAGQQLSGDNAEDCGGALEVANHGKTLSDADQRLIVRGNRFS